MRGSIGNIAGPAELQGMTIFHANPDPSGGVVYQTWPKPLGCSMIFILCIAGGGGGGSAANGAAGTDRDGAGAGGASNMTRVIYPAFIMPDNLYVQVGYGGAGGAQGAAANGLDGGPSAVAVQPSTDPKTRVVYADPGSGGVSTGAFGGHGAITTTADAIWLTFGDWASVISSSSSGAGGVHAAASGVNNGAYITMGGTGGAGASAANAGFAGGQINSGGWFGPNPGNSSGMSGTPAGAGQTRWTGQYWKPFINRGGMGGASPSPSSSGVGGPGCPGQYGCGGGGGAAGAGTGGAGGDGGPGIVFIWGI